MDQAPPPPSISDKPATKISFVQPLLWVIALEAISGLIGMLTAPESQSEWYRELIKAPLNPPSWMFGVVWPALYAMIALTGYRIWQRRRAPGAKWLWPLFLLQLAMNWAWSFIFFSGHLLWPAYIWLVALTVIVGLLVILLWRQDRLSAALMSPYLAWLCFATYLSWYIAAHSF